MNPLPHSRLWLCTSAGFVYMVATLPFVFREEPSIPLQKAVVGIWRVDKSGDTWEFFDNGAFALTAQATSSANHGQAAPAIKVYGFYKIHQGNSITVEFKQAFASGQPERFESDRTSFDLEVEGNRAIVKHLAGNISEWKRIQ